MSFKSPGLLRIPQWAVVSRVVTSNDVVYDENGVEESRSRTDLTGATIYFTVKDASGTAVIQKSSVDVNEIEILDQGVEATLGQARIKFVEADTATLSTTTQYFFDVWVSTAGALIEEPIIDYGRFFVDKSATRISVAP